MPGALVVYNAGGRFGQYGHVGKVMYYNKGLHKIIVRDMAWVSMFTMSDRRDDLTTANVECYIYNVRNTVVGEVITGSTTAISNNPTQLEPTQPQTGTPTPVQTTIVVPTPTTPAVPVTNPATVPTENSVAKPTTPVVVTPPVVKPPVVIPSQPVVTPPVVPVKPVVNDTASTKDITLSFDNISDPLIQHYVGIRDISAELTSKATLHIGDEAVLIITIKDKQTQVNVDGLLPTVLEFIGSNDNIDIDYSSVRLISDGKVEVHIRAVQAGKSSLVINLGIEKIGRIGFEIQ
ncbi:MAG: CHAP domain-containing protein [candidate division SR1 bacterium]|nr:CHAP domain-containing protein [candidate division SR1 bacterium]